MIKFNFIAYAALSFISLPLVGMEANSDAGSLEKKRVVRFQSESQIQSPKYNRKTSDPEKRGYTKEEIKVMQIEFNKYKASRDALKALSKKVTLSKDAEKTVIVSDVFKADDKRMKTVYNHHKGNITSFYGHINLSTPNDNPLLPSTPPVIRALINKHNARYKINKEKKN
ncbi:MAG: hypothetical protein ACOYT8_06485 [Candidatus Dependentiae bacterium]